MARSRFWNWERSWRQATTMPEGRCVMRTAVSTLLTFCPPLPPDRNVGGVFCDGRDGRAQDLGFLAKSPHRGQSGGSSAPRVLGFGVRSPADEGADDFGIVAEGCGKHQSRVSFPILQVGFRTFLKQELYELGTSALGGSHQRSLSQLIDVVDLRPGQRARGDGR